MGRSRISVVYSVEWFTSNFLLECLCLDFPYFLFIQVKYSQSKFKFYIFWNRKKILQVRFNCAQIKLGSSRWNVLVDISLNRSVKGLRKCYTNDHSILITYRRRLRRWKFVWNEMICNHKRMSLHMQFKIIVIRKLEKNSPWPFVSSKILSNLTF